MPEIQLFTVKPPLFSSFLTPVSRVFFKTFHVEHIKNYHGISPKYVHGECIVSKHEEWCAKICGMWNGKVTKYGYVIYRPLYPIFLPVSLVLETSPLSTLDPDSRTASPDFSPFRFNVPRGTFKLISIQSDFIIPIYIRYHVSGKNGEMRKSNLEERGERG